MQIAEKLPMYLQHRWKRQAVKMRENLVNPGVDELVQFVQSAAREVSDPIYRGLGVGSKSSKQEDRPQASKRKAFLVLRV